MSKVSLSFLMLIVIVTENTVLVDGLRCYNCDTKSHGDVCGADFKLTSSNTTFIVDDCHFCNKHHFTNTGVFIRNCTKNTPGKIQYKFGCKQSEVSGTTVETCACSDDLCNGAISGLTILHFTLLFCLSVYHSLIAFHFDYI